MSLNIIQRPVRTFNRGNNRNVTRIVLHHWVAIWTNTQTQNFLNNNGVSYHYGIDRNGETAQFVQDGDIAWHAGNANGNSIGIGVSNSVMAAPWPVAQRTLDLLPQLLAHISQRNNMGEIVRGRNFFLHREVGNSACPGPFLTERANQIVAEANRILRGGAAPPATPQPPPTGALHRVQIGAFASTGNANTMLTRLRNAGFSDAFIARGADNLHRVQVGAFSNRANAETMLGRVQNAGFRDAFIRT